MRKILLLLLLSCPLLAQTVQSGYVIYVTSAPSGSCSQNNRVRVVMGAGTVYTCQSGTWATVGGGGGGSGTVTSVLGTANQIASDGSTTTPTLSIPATFIAPGTISAVTSIDATKLLGNLPALNGSSLTNLPLCSLCAPLASPTFTGTVTLPASTSFVTPILGTPTSVTLTNGTGLPESGVTNLTSDLALKAPLASPTFSGTVTLPASTTLTTPTIASFTNATHNHTNAAGGGQLTDAALSAAVTVAKGGTGIASGTSGGVPCYIGSTTIASSAALTANIMVKGGGAGVCPGVSLLTDDGTTATYTGTGGYSAPKLISTVATGTAPLTVTSTTAVANLTLAADSQLPQISTNNKIASSAIATPLGASSNQGELWAVHLMAQPGGSSSFTADNTANVVHVVQWVLPAGWRTTITKVTFNVGTASITAGCTLDMGQYSLDGNTKIFSTGAASVDTVTPSGGTTGAGQHEFTLGSAATLDGGTYYLAWVENGCTVAPVFGGVTWGGGSTIPAMKNFGVTTPGPAVRVGSAANAASSGVLPTTLGNITAVNTASGYPNQLMNP
jgi:hypothetical protein